MSKNPYEKHVSYRFEVPDYAYPIEIVGLHNTDEGLVLELAETRKNGQEDCHMYGKLIHKEGAWRPFYDDWNEEEDGDDTMHMFSEYLVNGLLTTNIIAYVNEHPIPDEIIFALLKGGGN